jgi:hypothetical protein
MKWRPNPLHRPREPFFFPPWSRRAWALWVIGILAIAAWRTAEYSLRSGVAYLGGALVLAGISGLVALWRRRRDAKRTD